MIGTFGQMHDGQDVHSTVIGSERLSVRIITLGASVQSVLFDGQQMVLSSDVLSDYLGPLKYAGSIVGRVANRIAGAQAVIGGETVQLDANEATRNCLHGGTDGAGQLLWSITDHDAIGVTLSLHLENGHMGFPGALTVHARYEVHDETLRLEITATSDAETLCSFAPHGYWTLSDEPEIDAHEMRIAADHYLPLDAAQIPTGEIADVSGTQFDFRQARKINSAALDHNFCVGTEREKLRPVLWLKSLKSGVSLEVATTEAGVQIYDGRHFAAPRAGLAIEPQVWPDAVNQTGFPRMTLRKGETYRAVSEFRLCRAG